MWRWRLDVVLPLGVLAGLYGAGWWRLGRRARRLGGLSRVALFGSGLATIAFALLSPLDELVDVSFSAHMVQHLLLMMLAPPLLLLADPLPRVLWALPRDVRGRVGGLMRPGALARRVWYRLSSLPAAAGVSALILWLWHVPAAYELAVRHERIHDLEHLALFWAGVLAWWPIVNPAPRVRGHVSLSSRIAYLVVIGGQQSLLGLLLSMSPRLLYPFYAGASGPWDLSPLADQTLGGLIMWAVTALIGLVTLMVLLYRLLESEEHRGALPEPGLVQSHLP